MSAANREALERDMRDERMKECAGEMLEVLKSLADTAQENITDLGAVIQEGGEWSDQDRADLKRWGRLLEIIAKIERT